MAQNTKVAPTELGDAVRRLADLLDGAPSIQTAARYPTQTHDMTIILGSAVAVRKVADDLELPTRVLGEWPGHKFVTVDIIVGPVKAHIMAEEQFPLTSEIEAAA